ncbi:putative DMT superfamily transporter inner membrane protein [Ferrovum sp. JA12]|uniref:DMT family transporter n=1 Tax=Ferrovum sp. JA12 TaxID=1356299 RepID=UPI0007035320|nr:DMT family transporter [Ferrovum sp. JA12]KRH78076.1 putative DMT superfamily transporter inner membrane protein [Ferrovum sp. JA12]
MKSSLLNNAYFLLVLTALFWASNMVLGRALGHDIPPFTMAMGRWLVASLFIVPKTLGAIRQHHPELRRHWRILCALGILGIGGYNTFAYLGLQTTTATNGALLNSFIPIATMPLSWVLLKKHLSLGEYIGIVISLLGVLTIVAKGQPAELLSMHVTIGDFWVLVAVLDWALYTVLLHWRPASISPSLLLSAMVLIGIVVLMPAVIWELGHLQHPLHLSVTDLLGLLYMGIFPGYLSYVFYNRGVSEIGPSKASLFIHLMPVFGTLLAYLFLNETIHTYHLLGIAFIMSGILITMWIKKNAT